MPKTKHIFEPLFNNCCMIESKKNGNLAYEYFVDGLERFNIKLTQLELDSIINNAPHYNFAFRFLESHANL